jgi:hypothetical protein
VATYTITDATHDGRYTIATGSYQSNLTEVSVTRDAIMHFAVGTWTETLLATASLAFYADLASEGTVAIDVVVARDGVPSDTTVPLYRTARVGTLAITGNGIVSGQITLDLLAETTVTDSGVTFTWTPDSGFSRQSGEAALGAAWSKQERDPADSESFLDRSVTFVFRSLVNGDIEFGDDGGGRAPEFTATWTAANTGLVGMEYVRDLDRGLASGVLTCPKTGLDIPRDEAVQDGFTRMLVSPAGYDPPERMRPPRAPRRRL